MGDRKLSFCWFTREIRMCSRRNHLKIIYLNISENLVKIIEIFKIIPGMQIEYASIY